MPKYQYQISTQTRWMSSSGNALIAFYNKPGSEKKINIHSIEVYNTSKMNKVTTADTNAPAAIKLKLVKASAVSGGNSITPVAMDTDATAWPSTVDCSFSGSVTPNFIQVGSTLTMAGATAGSTTFTPGTTPAPAWTTNEHRAADRYLKIDSGGNTGVYEISANSATALTLLDALSTTVSTTGYLAELEWIMFGGVVKQLRTDASAAWAITNFGMVNRRRFQTGNIYEHGSRSDTQPVTVRADERVCLIADFPNTSLPLFISVILRREGTPDYTYVVDYYTHVSGPRDALFSLHNETGSGEVIYIESIQISEVGNTDTPYFQVVPISQVNSVSFNDSSRKINSDAFPVDTDSPALSTSVCEIFTDVPVSASGVPVSYIAEGSAAVPKGFNYLNTKDFVGPTYMAMFPEALAYKKANTTYFSTQTPGTYGAHLSQSYAKIKGDYAPLVIREGQGLAIVSGAETAAGSINCVGVSGFPAIEFAITFSTENATTPSLVLTGLQTGSEVLILNHDTGATLASEESNVSGTFSYSYDYAPGTAVDIIVHSLGYEYYRLDNIPLTTSGVSIPISQRIDRNYSNP
jgi:hypothetical protein